MIKKTDTSILHFIFCFVKWFYMDTLWRPLWRFNEMQNK